MDKHVPKSIILLTKISLKKQVQNVSIPNASLFLRQVRKVAFSLRKTILQSFSRGNFQHLTNIPNDENLN